MFKVLRLVVPIVFAGLLMAGCSNNKPSDVASKWLNAFYHADYDAAMPLSTEVTKSQLEQFSQLSGYVNDSMKKDLKKLTITIKDVKEKKDTAIATYVVSDTKKDQELVLVKQNGKWLVAFSKNDSYKASDFNNDQPPSADTAGAPAVPVDTSAKDTAKNPD